MKNELFLNFTKYTSAIVGRQENEFQLIGFGYWNFHDATMDSFRRIQPYYSLLYVLSGTHFIELNGQTHTIKANEIFIMPKDIPFRAYADKDDPPTHAFFEFCGTMSSSYLEDAGFTLQNVVQKCPQAKRTRQAIKALFSKYHEADSFCYFEVLSLFFMILGTFANPQKTVHTLKEDTFITNVKNFINLHCLSPNFSIADVTTEFFISHSYLCKKFKQKTGETVISYINERRMLNAEHLLKTTALSAAEISYLSGYTCYPHFITCFKRRHNLTTREYRENLRQRETDAPPQKRKIPRKTQKSTPTEQA